MSPLNKHSEEKSTWLNIFTNLSPAARTCRHEFGYYVKDRTCENYFNCADCVINKNVERLEASRRKHGWQQKPPENEVYGVYVPADRLYHRGHTWIKEESDGTYSVGLDDFGARLIGKPDSIELPEVGANVNANEPAWKMIKQKTEVSLLSPITGKVVETGSPDKGWYLRINPEGNGETTNHLLKGAEIRRWMMKEIGRLQVSLSYGDLGESFADGGVLLDDLPVAYPEANWRRVYKDMFLQG